MGGVGIRVLYAELGFDVKDQRLEGGPGGEEKDLADAGYERSN